jgi:RNA polymerase sigma-70 factor (ECF subfamily)
LVQAARAGDRDALDRLLRAHYDRLHALCCRLIGNEADALDACQEALITIARRLDRFDARSSFGTWAYRVTTNACFDELRRRGRRPLAAVPDELPAPGDIGEATAQRLDIDAALAQLPVEYRAAVVLRDLCGLPYVDIGEVLSIPVGTVRSRIARGRTLLGPLLGPGNRPEPFQRPTPAP